MGKKTWLRFEEESDTGKTKVWSVWNAENGSLLGHVKWRGAWRQYVYDTSGANYGVVWNPDCMDELTAFIRRQMVLRRMEKDRANGPNVPEPVFVHMWDLDGPACGAGVGFISYEHDQITCDDCSELLLRIENDN